MESVNFVIVLNSAISPEEGKQFLGHFKRHLGHKYHQNHSNWVI